jgi:hypothetical protein
MPKSEIQIKNKCKIKILKKQSEEITEHSVNDDNALGSTHFTYSVIRIWNNILGKFLP